MGTPKLPLKKSIWTTSFGASGKIPLRWDASRSSFAAALGGVDTKLVSGLCGLSENTKHSFSQSINILLGLYTLRIPSFPQLDAQTFADWGVDYLKEDSCYAPEDRQSSFEQYAKMRDSLNKTGRPIYFSLCGWKPWYAPVGTTLGNSWRISDDVNSWDDIYRATRVNMGLLPFAGPGGWNDPDMLLGSTPGAAATVTPVQSRTQFNLWVVMAAPLLIGSNLLHLSAFDRETYTNAEVLAVSQDPLGQPGFVVVDSCGEFNETGSPSPPECQQVWAKRLSRGAYAVLMVNWARHPVRVQCDSGCLQSVGLYGKVDVRDLWAQADLGPMEGITVDLKGGGPSAMFRLTSAQKEQNFSQ